MNGEQPKKHRGRQIIVFGLALYRGVLAIVLGIVLIFYPAKSQNLLMNLMGFFWLSSGLVLIHQERGSGQRMSWVVGLVGIFAELAVVFRNIARRWVPEIAVVELLGAVILVTGVLHMLGQFRHSGVFRRRDKRLHVVLGLLEIILGILLILSPLERGPIIYWTATIWSLIFGGLVIGGALVQRFGKETDATSLED